MLTLHCIHLVVLLPLSLPHLLSDLAMLLSLLVLLPLLRTVVSTAVGR